MPPRITRFYGIGTELPELIGTSGTRIRRATLVATWPDDRFVVSRDPDGSDQREVYSPAAFVEPKITVEADGLEIEEETRWV